MNESITALYDEEVLHGDEVPDAALELAGSKIVGGTRGFLYALFLLRIGQPPDLPPGINVLCYEVGRLFAGPPLFH